MNNETISAVLLGAIALVAGAVVVYWHIATKGTWRHWPAGRSLMGLLIIIMAGFGFGVINRYLGDYPAKFPIATALYGLFLGALAFIGSTIRAEMRAGKARARAKDTTPSTAPVTIVVASTNEESPND